MQSGHRYSSGVTVHLEGDRLRVRGQRLDRRLAGALIHGVGGGQDSNQDQHDQPHALLPIVGSVPKANAGAGEHQQTANPQRRRFVFFGRLIEFLVPDQEFHEQQQRPRTNKADQRRNQ